MQITPYNPSILPVMNSVGTLFSTCVSSFINSLPLLLFSYSNSGQAFDCTCISSSPDMQDFTCLKLGNIGLSILCLRGLNQTYCEVPVQEDSLTPIPNFISLDPSFSAYSEPLKDIPKNLSCVIDPKKSLNKYDNNPVVKNPLFFAYSADQILDFLCLVNP